MFIADEAIGKLELAYECIQIFTEDYRNMAKRRIKFIESLEEKLPKKKISRILEILFDQVEEMTKNIPDFKILELKRLNGPLETELTVLNVLTYKTLFEAKTMTKINNDLIDNKESLRIYFEDFLTEEEIIYVFEALNIMGNMEKQNTIYL